MNYEKKYNEALERARQFIEHPLQEDSANIVEYIFPELKESEDERIRKVLLNDFKNNCSEYYCEGVNRDMIIAWLEKQGKRDARYKYLEELLEADTEYQMAMNDAMVEEAKTKAMEAISDMPIFELLGLEKQGEQKTDPCTDYTNDKGCVTCEHGELRETHTRTLNADEVIEWLEDKQPSVALIDKFKKDFGL